MNYCLHITSAPYSEQGSLTAFRFAEALVKKHALKRVFFSGNGVLNASAFSVRPQDEINLTSLWQQLAQENKTELLVCVSSALRLGVINEDEANRYELSEQGYSLAKGFELAGLGQLVEASIEFDRVIRF